MTKKIAILMTILSAISSLPALDMVYGVPLEPFFCTEKLENPYGVCAHISRKALDGVGRSDWTLRDQEFSLMKQANIGNVRTDFDWDRMQKSKDEALKLDHIDAMMKSAATNHIILLPILPGGMPDPKWKYTDQWDNYVSALVKRYGNQIPAWEIWNEMNCSCFWEEPVSAEKYTELLKRTYKIIKSIDPKAIVVFGGLSELDVPFLEKAFADDAGQYFDVMNFHSYNLSSTPEALIPQFRKLQDLMRKYNLDKPVWVTETGCSTAENDRGENHGGIGFYNEVLPLIYKKLEINPEKSTIGVLTDAGKGFLGAGKLNIKTCFNMFKNHRYITLDELKTLDCKTVPVLIAANGESFPMEYFDALENYIRTGGTVIFNTGYPLFSNCITAGSETGESQDIHDGEERYKRLHMHPVFWWDEKSKELGVPQYPDWQVPAEGFHFRYRWDFKHWLGARYMDGKNLSKGDQFIPVLQSGNKKYTGTVIGVYKLNSDLKGNIIVQTRNDYNNTVSPETQAKRLVRTYLISFGCGVDRVYWYNLRAFERTKQNPEDHFGIVHDDENLSPKPAFLAYKVLTSMCPDKSTRPSLEEKDGVFLSSWEKPDGKKITAIWTPAIPRKVTLKINGSAEFYDYMGEKLTVSPDDFIANPGVIYIVGADSVSL